MIRTPAHKQTDPAKRPGQLINDPDFNHDLMDDMGEFSQKQRLAPAVQMCQCGIVPATECPEPWGSTCDLGNNENFVRRVA